MVHIIGRAVARAERHGRNALRRFGGRLRRHAARVDGVTIGDARVGVGVVFKFTPIASGRGTISIGESSEIGEYCVFDAYGGEIVIAERVFVGPHCMLYGHGSIRIGAGTLIAGHCRILSSEHAMPAMGETIRDQPDVAKPTVVGRGCWLGSGATVTGGVVVGDGAVVGAGAVVTRDVPAGAVVAGVPARLLFFRDGAGPSPIQPER